MNPLERLTDYLRRIERRLRWLALWRGAAITAGAALLLTVAAVLVANGFAFSGPSVLVSRVLLFLGLAFAVALGLIVPVLLLNRRRAAREAERRFPEFEERLLTLTERLRENPADPFLPLIASDSLRVVENAGPDRVAARGRILSFAGMAAGSLAVLVWLGTSGPGFLGYGTSLLWGGIPKGGSRPYYDVQVQPGNRTVRKRADQTVTARLVGFRSERVKVVARYASSAKWEEAEMRPQPGGAGWQFVFAGVPESLEYYVEAGGVRSMNYKLKVVDLAVVKRIRVTYHYPAWTEMKDAVEDPGGDLRAVEGTRAELSVETDRPLGNGALLLDDGKKIPLGGASGRLTAMVPIEKDGLYHVASVEAGEDVRLSEDYFIEAQKDRPPSVKITRPGRDARVSPIEEVAVAIEGKDDFGLKELALHYSVNGGPEKVAPLVPRPGAQSAQSSTTLYLEDYKLAPGDIVSLYATARDARSTSRTDIFFIEAQPFERQYTQSQQSGGGSGGSPAEEEGHISQRQKEIIAATWNQIKDSSGDKTSAGENAVFLAGVQSKLRDQARSLVARMRSRQLAGASDSMKRFAEDMDKAVEAMGPASDRLKGRDWQRALEPEQKALQYLLRAEAVFRDIQVAFGSRGGGGGGANGASRDLEGLFDLELDTEKNQYEAGQQSAADQQQHELDDALQKLQQLARRQQELAEQRRSSPQQLSEQRWQQEMLRREAEQLRQQIEQLSRQQSGQSSSGQSSSGQSGGARQEQMRQALDRMEQAMRDMRQAGGSQKAGTPESQADARRAAERLKEAQEMLSRLEHQQAGGQMQNLVDQAEQLAARQREFGNRLRQSFGSPSLMDPNARSGPAPSRQQAGQMADEKQRMLEDEQRLEAGMQRAARGIAGTEREASSKLRDALGAVQQEEVPARMRWSAEAIRRGLGTYAAMREAPVTQALEQLRDDLRQARAALKNGDKEQPGGAGDKKLEQALAQVERLRGELEKLKKGDGGAANPNPRGGDGRASPEEFGRAYQQGARDLAHMRQMVGENSEVARNMQTLAGELAGLDPRRFAGNPALLDQLHAQVLAEMAQVELELRRLTDPGQAGNVRSGASQPPPPGYGDAVAEYFRRLSKEK